MYQLHILLFDAFIHSHLIRYFTDLVQSAGAIILEYIAFKTYYFIKYIVF